MKVGILANDQQQEELLSKCVSEDTQLIFVKKEADLYDIALPDMLLILEELDSYDRLSGFNIPIIINCVGSTLEKLNLPINFHRINGWTGFLKRETWEIASNDHPVVEKLFDTLKWKYSIVKDVEGFVSARVIAMIINEAYLALEEGVSSKEEIDIAMKLGTNYPFGPFEWGAQIGLNNIYGLLETLSVSDISYRPSEKLQSEI